MKRSRCIVYGDLEIPYELIRSNRKSLAIEIGPGKKVLVRVPNRVKEKELELFLQAKIDWIVRMYKKQSMKKESGIRICNGAKLSILGRQYTLVVYESNSKTKVSLQESEGVVVVEMGNNSKESLYEIIEHWYREYARSILKKRVQFYANIMHVTYSRIAIKNQKTCWGSCSAKGNLNFNWHLVMMPVEVLDYVVIHELAHRIELNHSSNFWSLVTMYCSDYKERKEWLKKNGSFYQIVE